MSFPRDSIGDGLDQPERESCCARDDSWLRIDNSWNWLGILLILVCSVLVIFGIAVILVKVL